MSLPADLIIADPGACLVRAPAEQFPDGSLENRHTVTPQIVLGGTPSDEREPSNESEPSEGNSLGKGNYD